MSWREVLNSESHPWVQKSKQLLQSQVSAEQLPYLLSRCIFEIEEAAFNQYIDFIGDISALKGKASVGEVGCGNGGLLLALKNIYGIVPSGTDISTQLIEVCKQIHQSTANNFHVGTELTVPVDVCLLNSVCQYLTEAEVLNLIESTDCSKIVLTDIKNSTEYNRFIETQANRQGLTVHQRNRKYKNTPLTHFSKSFFTDLGVDAQIHSMPEYYPDSEFATFAVVINK
ncbi:class I SAM-dependent methyltransferase [Alphaproteobacteria bacterium]|nr:class I SAM-dependent methyltransferase [Alphaproteobacteria bacterium]